MEKRVLKILLLSVIIISFQSCRNQEKDDPSKAVESNTEEVGGKDLIGTVQGITALSKFAMELGVADIPEFQSGGGTYTIFAPKNSVFTPLYDETDNEIVQKDFDEVISYHIVNGIYTLEKLQEEIVKAEGEVTLSTLQGEEIRVIEENGKIWLEGKFGRKAQITETLDASNGVLHVLDQVLLPKEFSRSESGNQQ